MKHRTKAFALRAMRLADALPNSPTGRTCANQLVRSASSVGANYRSACRARSRAEFAAKLAIINEEADESCYWIELIIDADLVPVERVQELLHEAHALTAMTTAARQTLRHSQK